MARAALSYSPLRSPLRSPLASTKWGAFVPINAETNAYAAAASPAPVGDQLIPIDQAFSAWKSSGALAKMRYFHLYKFGVVNMKTPGTYDAISTGSQQSTHIATDGVSTVITLPDPTTVTGYAQDSAYFSLRRLNTGQESVRSNGWFDGTDGTGITSRSTANIYAYRINSASATSSNILASTPLGDSFITVNRSGANATQAYIDGIVQTDSAATANRASTALNANVMYLGRGDATAFFAGQYFSCSAGASLTAAEAAGLALGERILYKAFSTQKFFPDGQYPLIAAQQVPDGLGCDPGKGITCTGMGKVVGENAFWISNHGRPTQASGATFAPSIIKTDMTGATKLREINPLAAFPSVQSIQGVNQMDNGTLVFASNTEGVVRFMTVDGVAVAGSFAAVGVNGLSLDKPNNKMYLCTTATIIRCNMDGTGAETVITGGVDFDHLFYDPVRKWLFVTAPDNNQMGVVRLYDVTVPTSPVLLRLWTFASALAIEGVYFDTDTNVLYLMHDGYFHSAGNLLNQLQRYQLS